MARPELQPKPIRIVLHTIEQPDGTKVLVQSSLSDDDRKKLRDRYDEIDKPAGGGEPSFYIAFYHASRHHPGDPEPLIVLSKAKKDEMSWEVLDKDEKPESGFTVSVKSEDNGPDDPLEGFPKT